MLGRVKRLNLLRLNSKMGGGGEREREREREKERERKNTILQFFCHGSFCCSVLFKLFVK